MKNKSISILSILLLTTLAACNIGGKATESSPLTDNTANTANTSNTAETTKTESSQGSSSTSSEDTSGYRKLESNFDQQDYSYITDYPYTPSTGEINVLVIPVVVSDYADNATDKVKSDLEKAMFGKSEDTGWESLSSYYEKSSHGALKINGTVSDWYNPNLTSSEMAKKNKNDDYSTKLMKQAVSWYKSKYNDDCTKYDNNHDGYIDGVFLIYSAYDYYTGESYGENLDSNLFWAYTTMDYEATSNKTSPNGGYYFWASFDFLYEGYGEDKVDAHTFIHETGHMLSLDDYYSYTTKDKNGTIPYCPMGGVDMMDYNICDQDCFSKFVLGWNTPYYVDHEGDITISSAEDSLDCILIPTKKGEVTNAYDEYVMLELFSPTLGLNESDLKTGYGNYTVDGTLTKEGVRAYHVDNRICKFSSVDQYGYPVNASYADLSNIDENYYYAVAHSNSVEGYYDGDANTSFNYMNPEYLGITQLSKSNRVFDKNDYLFEDQDMYYAGDSFSFASSSAQFPNKTKMNNGSELAYNFTVTEIKDHKATIHFTKN